MSKPGDNLVVGFRGSPAGDSDSIYRFEIAFASGRRLVIDQVEGVTISRINSLQKAIMHQTRQDGEIEAIVRSA
jgi:hypothetical protein